MNRLSRLLLLACLGCVAGAAQADRPGSRLLATGGVTQVEGAGGGGLTPWALITGYGSRDEVGVTVFHTRADPTDFRFQAGGLAVGIHDRVELSYARQHLGLGTTVPGQAISQDIYGLKVKVLGDAVFDQDRWLPQVALGLQHKRNDDMNVPTALGARHSEGTDFYVAATKLWLGAAFGRNVLANATLRATKANQMGLLGFGGDRNDGYRLMPEVSVGVFLTDAIALGAEYRRKPDNLSAFREEDFKDVFVAWFPTKRLSLTAAWVDFGQIADKKDQRAFYLSAQLAF
jgi:hypothetical protein